MTIEADIKTRLMAYTALTALISTRMWQDQAPQNATAPYVVYQIVSNPRQQAITGAVVSALSRIQFTAWADSGLSANLVRAQVQAAILAMTGSTVTIYEKSIENESSGYESETKLYRRDLDIQILHSG